MISQSMFDCIEPLLAEGRLSRRAIAMKLGVSRTIAARAAEGKINRRSTKRPRTNIEKHRAIGAQNGAISFRCSVFNAARWRIAPTCVTAVLKLRMTCPKSSKGMEESVHTTPAAKPQGAPRRFRRLMNRDAAGKL